MTAMALIEPLPSTGISKILGMCEILEDKGGRLDLFELARDLHMPFSEVLLVIKAAEMLSLIDTPGHEAQMTAFGSKVLAAPIDDKKSMLGEQMLKLNVFQHIVKLLRGADRGELPAELILEELALRLPHETPRQMFTTLLNWGRYGNVFGYSRDTDQFSLHREEQPSATE